MSENEANEIINAAVKDVLQNPSRYATEKRFILVLDLSSADGALFVDTRSYRVLKGEIREIVLDHYEHGDSPHYVTHKVAIIPLSIPVIIEVWDKVDYPDRYFESLGYYIFTKEGWKYVQV